MTVMTPWTLHFRLCSSSSSSIIGLSPSKVISCIFLEYTNQTAFENLTWCAPFKLSIHNMSVHLKYCAYNMVIFSVLFCFASILFISASDTVLLPHIQWRTCCQRREDTACRSHSSHFQIFAHCLWLFLTLSATRIWPSSISARQTSGCCVYNWQSDLRELRNCILYSFCSC